MTLRTVYYLAYAVKRCSGTVEGPEREIVVYLQDLDELVQTPEGYEAKKTPCLHVCVCPKKYQVDR